MWKVWACGNRKLEQREYCKRSSATHLSGILFAASPGEEPSSLSTARDSPAVWMAEWCCECRWDQRNSRTWHVGLGSDALYNVCFFYSPGFDQPSTLWLPFMEAAVNLIYQLAEGPEEICAQILKDCSQKTLDGLLDLPGKGTSEEMGIFQGMAVWQWEENSDNYGSNWIEKGWMYQWPGPPKSKDGLKRSW